MISCSKQLQRLLLMIIKAWNTAWSPVESLSFLTRLSAIWYQWNQRIHHQSTIIIYHVLCSMQVLRTQKKMHHQKISKGLLSTTSTPNGHHKLSNTAVTTELQTAWSASFSHMGANLPAAPKLLLQNDTSHSQKLTPNSTYGTFCGMNGMNGMKWRAFPFQFLPNCPMISCRHRTGHSGDLRWLVNSPPASGNECTKVRRTSQTKRPAWRCHQSWTWWVSQCFPARCCKMLQAAARDGDDGMT